MKNKFKHKYEEIANVISGNLKEKFHHKTILSISNATFGLLNQGKATISKIGEGYANGNGTKIKHGIKQVDGLLSNKKFNIKDSQETITKLLTKNRNKVLIAIDWTDFYKDNQTTLSAKLVTKHGRATPLVWQTYYLDKIKGMKFIHENELLKTLYDYLPKDAEVVILADRGFGSQNRLSNIKHTYRFEYVIRFKKNIYVQYKSQSKLASEWLHATYTSRKLKDATLTKDQLPVNMIVIIKDKDMKDYWCLACSCDQSCIKTIKKYYAKRWSCECSFRDEKNFYSGFGLYKSRIKNKERRDRLLTIIALAIIILTILGHISEKLKLDKHIKANTTKYRTHSLFRQGLIVFSMLCDIYRKTKTKILNMFKKISIQLFDFSGVYSAI